MTCGWQPWSMPTRATRWLACCSLSSRQKRTRGRWSLPRKGSLEWHSLGALPVADMAPDLPIILPRILAPPEGAAPLFLSYTYDEHDRLIVRFAENS